MKKMQVAILVKEAVASKTTYSDFYAKANDIATKSEGNIEKFNAAAKEMKERIRASIKEEKLICNYQGFDILMPTNMLRNKPYVYIKHKNKYKLDLGMTDTGIMIRIDNFFDDFDKYIENVYTEILKTESRMEDIKSELSKDSSYIDNIVLLKEELKEIDKKLGVNK